MDELRSLVDWESVLPLMDGLFLLTALRDDEPIPDLTPQPFPEAVEGTEEFSHPRLAPEDLDRLFRNDVAQAEDQWRKFWGDEEWESEAQRDMHRAQELAEAESEAIRSRAQRAGDHLRALTEYIAHTLWPQLTEAVEEGRRDAAIEALTAACVAAADARPGYEQYEVSLSTQYEKDPSSLGAMGEFLSDFEGWLRAQAR